MYNTVGETAGVTQDVGSDPTVGDSEFDAFRCCTLCGMELEEEEEEEGILEGGEHEGEMKGVNVTVFDLDEMSRMEDEDEEMDGEPDTTGDGQYITCHYEREKGNARESSAESGLHIPQPQSARLLDTLG